MSQSQDSESGIKKLDATNWLEPDPASQSFVAITQEGAARRMEGSDWAKIFLSSELSGDCPEEVLVAFNVARGSLIYGYFFYPLYTQGRREVLHVADMALVLRCRQLSLTKRETATFEARIDSLVSHGRLSAEEGRWWHAIRRMRNALVHADHAVIEPPAVVAGLLGRVAEYVNRVFADA